MPNVKAALPDICGAYVIYYVMDMRRRRRSGSKTGLRAKKPVRPLDSGTTRASLRDPGKLRERERERERAREGERDESR